MEVAAVKTAEAGPPAVLAPTGRQTVLVAVGQAALMAFGALIALLVAQFYGKTSETDAFFAAYGVYTVGVIFSGTFRLTAVTRLVRPEDPAMATYLLGSVLVVAGLLAVPMVVFAEAVGAALVAEDPTGAAPTALRLLWIAVVGQLLFQMLATMMVVRGQFVAIGVLTMLVGLVTTGVFVATSSSLGVEAAALGLAVGNTVLFLAAAVAMLRRGWRLVLPNQGLVRGILREARRLGYASLTFAGANLAYVVSLAVVTRQGEGEATLYAYAYVLAGMLIAVTANVSAMTRAPSLVAGEERTRDVAAASAWSMRFTLIIGGPALALSALVGTPLIAWALGAGFDQDDAVTIVVTVGALTGWVVASAAGVFAIVELLARDSLRRLAVLATVQVGATLPLVVVGAAVGGTIGVAAGLSVVMLGVSVVQLHWAFGELPTSALIRMVLAVGRELLVIVIAFAPSVLILLAFGRTAPSMICAGALAVMLVGGATRAAWPADVDALLRSLRRG